MVYRFHQYTLDPAGRELRHNERLIALEPKVFQVLLYLLEHRDRVVTKDELLAQCWPETFVSEAAITRCLARLRTALQAAPTAPSVIKTLHRQGYRFVADVTALAPTPPQTLEPPAPPVASALPAHPAAPHSRLFPTLPVRPATSGAERRQLTVLCCDLADATTLAGQLDPEDFRAVLLRYQTACMEVVQRYGGHVAQYLGEGLLVYFGWPQAHEDDARRAVHTGLALVLVTAIHTLGNELVPPAGLRPALRVGIHTGLAVLGDMAGGPQYGPLAVGATPTLAARMQSLARPDTVVISDATYDLVQGYFVWEPLGEHSFPGITVPCALYHVLDVSEARGRLDVTPPPQRTPFVGREAELAVLRERVSQVQQGLGQIILLSGEAGIGKSRLVQEVKAVCMANGFTAIECHCSPYTQHTALHPVVEWLHRAIYFGENTPGSARLERLEQLLQHARLDPQEGLPLLAALLSLDLPAARSSTLHLTPQRQRQRTLDTLVALVLGRAARQPVLLIVEDLHWSDPSTLEWLGMLVDQGPTAPLLTLLTCRPAFVSPWGSRAHVTLLSVLRLASPYVRQMARWLGGEQLSAGQLQRIVAQTDGVPLFVEEVTRFVLAAHRLHGPPEGLTAAYTAPEAAIPATLQDALTARLDQLGSPKATAQLGAMIGREFPYALLKMVTPLEEDLLRQDLQHLVAAELLYQRGVGATAVYQFKHALIQEVAYASLLRRTRQQYHQQIAQALETHFPDTVATQPELLAQHYTEAGRAEQAIPYWQRAGQHANDRSAYLEAISHFTTGIALLETLPATPAQTQQALTLHIGLGAALLITKGAGAPEVEHAYTQARALCEQVGEMPELVQVLVGLWRFYAIQAQLYTARELGGTLQRLAQRADDPVLAVIASYALGIVECCLGALPVARQHLEAGLARYTPDQHRALVFRMGVDPGVACQGFAGVTRWLMGYPDQALTHIHHALALAQGLSHPYSLAWARFMAAFVAQLRRDVPAVHEHAAATVALSTEQSFAQWVAWGTTFREWALTMRDQGEEGIAHVSHGVAAYRATGAKLFVPYFYTLLAEVCIHLGHTENGLQALAEAHTLMEQQEERWWEAEIHRLRGVMLLRQTPPAQEEAATCLQQALAVARHQQARSLELRAAMSLARLWQQQGKSAAARGLLAPLYGWFTEGFETADLQEARALLEQLA